VKTILRVGALALGLWLGISSTAMADGLRVAPIKLFLSASEQNGLLTVRNEGTEPGRYQVSVSAWTESPSGEMVLTPTKDVVFFPALFSLKPNEERNIRVGVTAKAGAVERTFRIFVEELPSEKTGTGVRLLTRMGMPIFLQPEKPAGQPVIEGPTVTGGKLTFKVKNTGNAHVEFTAASAQALDAAGASVFQHEWKGWYLLAGGERVFEVDLPGDACGKAAGFTASFDYEKAHLKGSSKPVEGACAHAAKDGG
jgi:fimbrial chaperone protein